MHKHVMCNGKDVWEQDKKGTERITVLSFIITVTRTSSSRPWLRQSVWSPSQNKNTSICVVFLSAAHTAQKQQQLEEFIGLSQSEVEISIRTGASLIFHFHKTIFFFVYSALIVWDTEVYSW